MKSFVFTDAFIEMSITNNKYNKIQSRAAYPSLVEGIVIVDRMENRSSWVK